MKTWFRQHRQAIAAAFGKLVAQKSAAVLNAVVIGIALSLPAGGYALLASLRTVTQGAALEPQLSVFLRVEDKRPEADVLGTRLKADARLGEVRFVPREQALKELQATEGMAEVIAALGRNPLPSDRRLISDMVKAGGDATFADLATRVVTSRQFRNRAGGTR